MNNDTELIIEEAGLNDRWVDEVSAALPDEIAQCKSHGKLPNHLEQIKVQLSIETLTEGNAHHFKARLGETLFEIFNTGAHLLGQPLLPPDSHDPLDKLHFRAHHKWSNPLTHFERPLWLALAEGATRHFGIEYVLAVKINTKWGVSSMPNPTPKVLLSAFGFNPDEFSLYKPDSTAPLPPDVPLSLKRGDRFEAQKDGKYGSVGLAVEPRGNQTIEDDVESSKESGIDARLIIVNGQRYVEVRGLLVPFPPWSKSRANILIAVPGAYPIAGLDAFYVEQPFGHSSGSIPKLQSSASIDSRTWGLISWHYASNRTWNARQDDLASHISHCRGFFLGRGVGQ